MTWDKIEASIKEVVIGFIRSEELGFVDSKEQYQAEGLGLGEARMDGMIAVCEMAIEILQSAPVPKPIGRAEWSLEWLPPLRWTHLPLEQREYLLAKLLDFSGAFYKLGMERNNQGLRALGKRHLDVAGACFDAAIRLGYVDPCSAERQITDFASKTAKDEVQAVEDNLTFNEVNEAANRAYWAERWRASCKRVLDILDSLGLNPDIPGDDLQSSALSKEDRDTMATAFKLIEKHPLTLSGGFEIHPDDLADIQDWAKANPKK